MGRRYDTARYREVVETIRAAVPGVALHADVIAGFPTETEAAFERTERFVGALDLAGLHVFRYSARPGTPAIRMAGQVDEVEKKRRAARLLERATVARERWAARAMRRERSVLFESRLGDGRWLGKSEDYVTVSAQGEMALENAIARVVVDAMDPEAPDRAVGSIVAVDPPRSTARRALPIAPAGGSDAA
jgi:threonylcarbamoyladenosine tRNA methylthiotransferase MtaB